MSLARLFHVAALPAAVACLAGPAAAHTPTVDGSAADWFGATTATDNLGILRRGAATRGEYVWKDATADARTDFSTPEDIADLREVRVTGDATKLYVLIVLGAPATGGANPVQIQIALDLDRAAGSGEEFLDGLGDTRVNQAARWEYLVQTLFGQAANTARLRGAGFTTLGPVTVAEGATGVVEFEIPWADLGLSGPPTSPLRFSIATFRDVVGDDLVADIAGVPDALDVVTDYGDPSASAYPNTLAEFGAGDDTIGHHFDVHFGATGEPRAPLVITRFSSDRTAAQGGDWISVRNVTAGAISLDGHLLGDEETPDGGEAMRTFPPGLTLAAGQAIVIARDGADYQTGYTALPDAEFIDGTAAPNLTSFANWATGALTLSATGDEILLLDASRTIIDVATWGTAAYPGVTPMTPAPGPGTDASRDETDTDTDDCDVDFRIVQCNSDAECAGCEVCQGFVCVTAPDGTGCDDGDLCTVTDACSGGTCAGTAKDCSASATACENGVCNAGTGACEAQPKSDGASCDDGDPCTETDVCTGGTCAGSAKDCSGAADACNDGSCNVATGACEPSPKADGTACDDGSPCTLSDACASGSCAGTAKDCSASGNACNDGACNAITGACEPLPKADGTPCDDGIACSDADQCTSGACAGALKDCSNLDDRCNVGVCNAVSGQCGRVPYANGTRCNDSNPCTTNDECTAGTCDGTPVIAGTPCNDECNVGTCSATTGLCDRIPRADGTTCDDGDLCSENDTCTAGACAGAVVNCSSLTDECNVGTCDVAGGCVAVPVPDGTACTGGTCQGGACSVPADAGVDGAAGAAGAAGAGGTSGAAGSAGGGAAGQDGGVAGLGGSGGDSGAGGTATAGAGGASPDGGAGTTSAGAGGTGGTGGTFVGGAGGVSGTGATADSGTAGTGGSKSSTSGDDGGCGCRVPARRAPSAPAVLAVTALAALLRRRRR